MSDVAQESSLEAWRLKFAPGFLGQDEQMLAIFSMIRRIASTQCSVLVTGPSGTGKELVAQAVHQASDRKAAPFVAVNCAAIPRELMESEIFGHARGAFTGAHDKRVGKFALAHGGTLFLDEVGEMDLELQSKFLRVIQEREFTPVGSSTVQHADVRIIAASNRDLLAHAEAGKFREDLYYRLNVIPIRLPALRDRPGDVVALFEHFLEHASMRHNRRIRQCSEAARQRLLQHPWPGNVRELQNLAERIVVLKPHDGVVECSDLPADLGGDTVRSMAKVELPASGLDIREAMEQFESKLTMDALRRSKGNKAQAAQLLGLKRTTLVERLKRLNLHEAV